MGGGEGGGGGFLGINQSRVAVFPSNGRGGSTSSFTEELVEFEKWVQGFRRMSDTSSRVQWREDSSH